MKYKISEESDFTVVTEDGDFVCSVIDDEKTMEELLENREQLEYTARRIVIALNSIDISEVHVQQAYIRAVKAGLHG